LTLHHQIASLFNGVIDAVCDSKELNFAVLELVYNLLKI
jgi:hypothetical protein